MKITKAFLIAALTGNLLAVSSVINGAEISVGAISGPETGLVEKAKEIAKQRYDLDVTIVEFNDYVTPNIALADGTIDANAFQHKPYLDRMVNDRGFDLVSAGATFVYPIGAYSKKHKDIADLPKGATIAVPNDPSNEGRALLLLEKAGLITLVDSSNLEASVLDIAENPNNYKFKEIEAPQLPRVLGEVDLAFINSTFAVPVDLIPARDALLLESSDSPYTNLVAVRTGDETRQEVIDFVKSYQSAEVEAKALELFKGAAIKGW